MANYKFSKLSESVSSIYGRGIKNCSFHISTTNSKLGFIPSFNLLPGITCLHEGCYAVKNAFRCGYDVDKNTTLKAWTENTVLAMHDLKTLEKKLIICRTAGPGVPALCPAHDSRRKKVSL